MVIALLHFVFGVFQLGIVYVLETSLNEVFFKIQVMYDSLDAGVPPSLIDIELIKLVVIVLGIIHLVLGTLAILKMRKKPISIIFYIATIGIDTVLLALAIFSVYLPIYSVVNHI